MMAGEKDIFIFGAAGYDQVENKAQQQNTHGFHAQHFLGDGDNGFIIRNNAADIKSSFDNTAQRVEIGNDNACASAQHQIA